MSYGPGLCSPIVHRPSAVGLRTLNQILTRTIVIQIDANNLLAIPAESFDSAQTHPTSARHHEEPLAEGRYFRI